MEATATARASSIFVLAIAVLLAGQRAAADDESPQTSAFAESPAVLAPVGVRNASTLPKGGWAVSYRYSLIHSDDLRDGRHRVSSEEALLDFLEAPTKRDVHVHRIGLAYAPHARVTLSAELPILAVETSSLARGSPPSRFENHATGVGDLELRVLVPFMRKGAESLQLELGLSVPTGSFREKGRDGAGDRTRLPFPQQLGSGSVELLPGLVYRGSYERLSWGFVARAEFPIHRNSRGYRHGSAYELSSWIAQTFTDWLSMSLRASWNQRADIHSQERTLQNPEAGPKRQRSGFIDVGPGVNFRVPLPGGPRFGVEMSWPVFQDVDGPHLERDWQLTTGLEWAF